MSRNTKSCQEADLFRYLNGLDMTRPPAIVHSSKQMNLHKWQARVQVAKDFYGPNHQQNVQQIQAVAVTADIGGHAPAAAGMPAIQIVRGAKDGVQHGFDQAPAGVKPVVMIAADAKILGGKPFGKGTVGNAQEEAVCNSVALVPAMASKGLMSHVGSGGKVYASRQFTAMMESRQALHMSNVPAVNPTTGQACHVDTVQVVAPDLRKKRHMSPGDIKQYAQEIYKVYRNALAAMVENSDPNQPLVITFPGSGVFAGPKDRPEIQQLAREIQGLCLREAMQNTPGLAGRNISATYMTPGSGADLVHNVATGAAATRHGLASTVATAIAGIPDAAASSTPVSAQTSAPIVKPANKVVNTSNSVDLREHRRAAKAKHRQKSRKRGQRQKAELVTVSPEQAQGLARLMQQVLELNYTPTVGANNKLQFKSDKDLAAAEKRFGGRLQDDGLAVTRGMRGAQQQLEVQSQNAFKADQRQFEVKYQLRTRPKARLAEAHDMVVGTTVPRSISGLQPEGVLRFKSASQAQQWLKDNGLEGRKLVRSLPNGESALFFSKQQMKDQLGFKPGADLAATAGVFASRHCAVEQRLGKATSHHMASEPDHRSAIRV